MKEYIVFELIKGLLETYSFKRYNNYNKASEDYDKRCKEVDERPKAVTWQHYYDSNNGVFLVELPESEVDLNNLRPDDAAIREN